MPFQQAEKLPPRPAGVGQEGPPAGAELAARSEGASSAQEPIAATGSIPPPGPLVIRPYRWAATRENGHIVLTGHVPSEAVRAAIGRIAGGLPGTKAVSDRMQLAAGAPSTVDFVAAAGAGLHGLAELRAGSVALTETQLSVRGEAKDRDALATLQLAMGQLPEGLAPATVAVTAAVVAPYRFSASRGDGRLVLRGHVPSREARDEIRARIRERFFHERVADETRVADGAPPAFIAGATSAIEALSQLASGEAAVEDATLKVSGEALYAQAAEAMHSRIADAAPAGWRATADVALRDEQASPGDSTP
jgi:osmotically-inducible protein OsmY